MTTKTIDNRFLHLQSHDVLNVVSEDITNITNKCNLSDLTSLKNTFDSLQDYNRNKLIPLLENISDTKNAFYGTNNETYERWNSTYYGIRHIFNSHVKNITNLYIKLENKLDNQ